MPVAMDFASLVDDLLAAAYTKAGARGTLLDFATLLVYFDAHGDFNTVATTPSHFVGGMVLVIAGMFMGLAIGGDRTNPAIVRSMPRISQSAAEKTKKTVHAHARLVIAAITNRCYLLACIFSDSRICQAKGFKLFAVRTYSAAKAPALFRSGRLPRATAPI